MFKHIGSLFLILLLIGIYACKSKQDLKDLDSSGTVDAQPVEQAVEKGPDREHFLERLQQQRSEIDQFILSHDSVFNVAGMAIAENAEMAGCSTILQSLVQIPLTSTHPLPTEFTKFDSWNLST